MDVCTAAFAQQKCINKKISKNNVFTQFQESSLQLIVIKTQVLPSSRATDTAGAPETQGIQKHLRKPLASPFAFNNSVTTLRAEGPNPQAYVLQTYTQTCTLAPDPLFVPWPLNWLTVQTSMPFQQCHNNAGWDSLSYLERILLF